MISLFKFLVTVASFLLLKNNAVFVDCFDINLRARNKQMLCFPWPSLDDLQAETSTFGP